jgi:hypothetical protein
MARAHWLIVAVVILPCTIAEAQQPNTLTLACKGTAKIIKPLNSPLEYDPDPISMGFIVNFTAKTVQGTARWGPYLFDDQIPITE